jgi:hypothetical protein
MAEFFMSSLNRASLFGIKPVPLIEILLTLFHVFLKLARWPSRLGLPGGWGTNALNQPGDTRLGNGFLFQPID